MSDLAKMQAAAAALEFVEDGMLIGLGTGSTANHFIRMLGDRVAEGLNVGGLPTSEASRRLAQQVGVPLIEIDQADRIDLTIDGADEIDPDFRLLKGGGGALLREKIIAHASDVMIVIADDSKTVTTLGKFPLPVEVTPFGFTITAKKVFDVLRAAGCAGTDVAMREAGAPGRPYLTDNGNYILDCQCGAIPDADLVCQELNRIPGVMENGIFPLFASTTRGLILGSEDGVVIKGLG
ncbi:MAG: ribose-5-phosphate isomerase RpiA [Hyphomonadaceae bacterium]|jgi:ribose 5-phosphate isomerase A|nr:ribose-5-phosphate isomerase RpiA [Hyphomonadaceae bacterium]